MTPRPRRIRLAAMPLVCALALSTAALTAGCQRRPAIGEVSAADRAACRQRADEVFDKQNREEVYRTDVFAGSTRDAPFSVAGLPNDPSRGLASQYQRDTLLDDCLRSKAGGAPTGTAIGTGTNPTPPANPPSATPGPNL